MLNSPYIIARLEISITSWKYMIFFEGLRLASKME